MTSLKKFRQMAGLPDTIRRWKDAAEQVRAGQRVLTEQALVSKRSLEKEPMDWNPQVNRRHAERDGRKPEDFRWDQWPLSNVRIEPSENWRIPFWYACDYAEGTPLDNQYDDAGNRFPEPVGMCLQSIFFFLIDPDTGATLDEQDTLPAEGKVMGPPRDGSDLWKRLTPAEQPGGHNTIKVKLRAFPRFYFLGEDGGMQGHYAAGNRGHFHGAEVESPVFTLSMDHDGNVTVKAA